MSSNNDLGVVLVIGGCGYLGSNLIRLLSLELSCTAIHSLNRNPSPSNAHPAVAYHAGDIANPQQVTALLKKIKPKVIIHTASPRYFASEKELRQTNIAGTKVLLQCAAKNSDVRAFVYTSTDSVLVQNQGVKLTEETCEVYTESSKVGAYGKTKAVADTMVLSANDPKNLSTAVIRLPPIYGEYDPVTLALLLTSIKKGQHNIQIGDNKRIFEFVYVDSACSAHILAAKGLLNEDSKVKKEEKVNGEAFFISDGVSMPYFDFPRKVCAFAGHPVEEKYIKIVPPWAVWYFTALSEWAFWAFTFGTVAPELRLGGVEYVIYGGCEWSIEKAKKRLGFQPVPDQDAVLKKVVEHEVERLWK